MGAHMINGELIHTYYDNDIAFWGGSPWVATFDGYDGAPIDYDTPSNSPIGYGMGEDEAIENLLG